MSELSPQQKSALEKFRKAVADVPKPDENDGYLLLWLRARKFDVEKAAKMLRESMAWRKKVGADHILETWQLPKVIQKCYPIALIGYDKEGCPVWLHLWGHADVRGLRASVNTELDEPNITYLVEKSRKAMAEQSLLHGRYVYQMIAIVDMEDLTFRNAFYRPILSFAIRSVKLQEANYPDLMKKMFIINAPNFIVTMLKVAKYILSEETFNKIEVFDSDRSKWVPAILEMIDADQLPKYWGGNIVDPDGNPKCPSKICLGGEVPTFYYLSHENGLSGKNSYDMEVVKNGSSFQIDFDVTQPKSRLSWSFQTDDYDIGFEIKCKGSGDVLEEVVPYARVDSHLSIIEGQTEPLDPGKYVVIFDNSYSMMTSKSLCYFVEVILPQSKGKKNKKKTNKSWKNKRHNKK